VTLKKQNHLTVAVGMMKTLLLWDLTIMRVGAKFIFCQHHNTCGILVVSILSLEATMD